MRGNPIVVRERAGGEKPYYKRKNIREYICVSYEWEVIDGQGEAKNLWNSMNLFGSL